MGDVKGIHYEVPVNELGQAVEFYAIIFAREPDYKMEDEAGFVLAPGISINVVKSSRKPVNNLTIAVDDIAGLFKKIKDRGVRIAKEPHDVGYAVVGAIEDPFGNTIHFAQ